MSEPFDAAVIGAGFAGIACAAGLAARGRRVALIERRPALGGRVHSHRDTATGDVIDNGPHVMVGAYRRTRALLRLLGTESRVRFQPRLALTVRSGEGDHRFRRRLPRDLGLAAGLAGMRGISLREVWLTRGLLPSARNAGRSALDHQTCVEWFDALGIPGSVRRLFLDPICTAALNDTPARSSAALFAGVLRRAFEWGSEVPGPDGLGFILGPHTVLFEGAIERLVAQGRGEVISGRGAERVVFTGEQASGVALADGREVRAKQVVVAVSHRHVPDLFDAAQRASVDQALIDELGAAPIVSIHLWLDRPVMDGPLLGLVGCPTQFLYGVDAIWPQRSRHHRVVGIISGPTGDVAKSNDALAEQTLGDIRAMCPGAERVEAIHRVVVKEREATFLPKPGLLARRPGPATPWRNVWWAGDWTATGLPSTIEGACESGFAAARMILGGE